MKLLGFLGGAASRKFMVAGLGLVLALIASAVAYHAVKTGRLQVALSTSQSDAKLLEKNRDAWMGAADSAIARINVLLAEEAAARAAVQDLRAQLDASEPAYELLVVDIREAPATDDGPVAPVLRRTLEALP